MDTPNATQDERTWGLVAHLFFFAGFIIPFGNLIGPLVLWQMKKDESAFVAEHAKESLNFQLTCTIAAIACLPLLCIVVGVVLLPALLAFELIFVVIAAVRAYEGDPYRYPWTFRFIA